MKAMNLYFDPTPDQLHALFASSEHNAAKWIKAYGKMIFFRPEDAQHAEVARMVGADTYEKGLAIPNASSVAN